VNTGVIRPSAEPTVQSGRKICIDTNNLGELQQDLAVRSHWNIGFFMAGFFFWAYVAIVGSVFDLGVAKTYRLVGADPFTKGNKLADLVGFTHMSVIALSFPLVIASYRYNPELIPQFVCSQSRCSCPSSRVIL
jgi:hypothetical protein